ncbi:restriction endonuclease [Hyphomicrobium sp. NDB2Meth4]|uniref:restriction endonuclease n=1 Tax=Hyphomicrobium sp. NDB2Meth4 TaxID=1892846 RepID=UPI000A9956CA|nr:restriction endonuclease [Hyphomicrobium sp. NDB2Meth4]
MNRRSTPAEQLERQIERIHRLLEAGGAKITWNDRIPDPDNPTQLRQIDVSIRRSGHVTIVECRFRKEPEDVTWIEELIGRRESLRCDAVIAVSAAGFTQGAIKKANAKGIILRTLESLSADEVKNWGRPTKVETLTYEFLECAFELEIASQPAGEARLSLNDGADVNLLDLLGMVMNRLEQEGIHSGTFETAIDLEDAVLLSGRRPSRALFLAKGTARKRELQLASVVGYSAVGASSPGSYAIVRHFDSDTIEIIDSSRELAVVLDLSGADLHLNEYVRAATFDFGPIQDVKWFHVIGVDGLKFVGNIPMRIRFPTGS